MHEVRERAAAARSLPGNRELLSALLGKTIGTLEGVA
jgi:hypothetical protein